jgi:hypothetical protein
MDFRKSPFIKILHWGLLAFGIAASVATNLADPPSVAEQSDTTQPTSCQSDQDCAAAPNTLHCLTTYSLCVQCLEDAHCDATSRCHDNTCVARCTDNASCPEGLTCREGVCQECEADSDCGSTSKYCYQTETLRACRPVCEHSAECAGPGYEQGDVCRGGHCQPVTCTSDLECILNEEWCDPDAHQCRNIDTP